MCERSISVKRIKVVILGGIIAVLFSSLFGCNMIDNNAVNTVEDELSNKYGKTFVVSDLGNRFNNDTTTAYVYASDDPSTRFEVRVNSDGEIVFENYAYRKVCSRVRKIVCDIFSEYDLETVCVAEFSEYNYDISAEASIKEYIEASEADIVKAAIAVKSDEMLTGEILEKIYTDIGNQIPEIPVGFSMYILSEEDYTKVFKEIENRTSYFGIGDIRAYGVTPITEFYVEINDGQLSETITEINEALLRR